MVRMIYLKWYTLKQTNAIANANAILSNVSECVPTPVCTVGAEASVTKKSLNANLNLSRGHIKTLFLSLSYSFHVISSLPCQVKGKGPIKRKQLEKKETIHWRWSWHSLITPPHSFSRLWHQNAMTSDWLGHSGSHPLAMKVSSVGMAGALHDPGPPVSAEGCQRPHFPLTWRMVVMAYHTN